MHDPDARRTAADRERRREARELVALQIRREHAQQLLDALLGRDLLAAGVDAALVIAIDLADAIGAPVPPLARAVAELVDRG